MEEFVYRFVDKSFAVHFLQLCLKIIVKPICVNYHNRFGMYSLFFKLYNLCDFIKNNRRIVDALSGGFLLRLASIAKEEAPDSAGN